MTVNNSMPEMPSEGAPEYELHPDLVGFIGEALAENDAKRLDQLLTDLHPADIGEIINQLRREQRENFLAMRRDMLPPETLLYIESDVKDAVVQDMGAELSAEVIGQLPADDALQVMEDLAVHDQKEILREIPPEQRAALREGLSYPVDSAGRMMDPEFVAVPPDWTVGQTIDFLRDEQQLPEEFYSIYVLDGEQKPIGYVLVSQVLRNKRSKKMVELMHPDVHTVARGTDQEKIARMFRKYSLSSAPVVDDNGCMVAVITVDDIVDVIEEEAEEDILRLGGLAETDLHAHAVNTAKRRFPWLFVNLITAILASAVIMGFEAAIAKLVALAVLMPIVASMAGNAGTQTLTIAVRAIATRELTANNARAVLLKEIGAAGLNGALFGVLSSVVAWVVYADAELGFVLGSAMFCVLLIAAFAGAVIPLLLHRLGVDPAVASVVFLTTVTDVTSFFIFLGLAAAILL